MRALRSMMVENDRVEEPGLMGCGMGPDQRRIGSIKSGSTTEGHSGTR